MSHEIVQPKWHKEILSFKGIMSTFMIEGNIYDRYPCFQEQWGKYLFYNLNDLLCNFFDSGSTENSYDFLFYDPSLGFFDPVNKKAEMTNRLGKKRKVLRRMKEGLSGLNENRNESNVQMVKDAELIRAVMTTPPEDGEDQTRSTAVVLNFASRFVSVPDNLSEDEMQFFLNLQYASNNAALGNGKQRNTLILIVDKLNDSCPWGLWDHRQSFKRREGYESDGDKTGHARLHRPGDPGRLFEKGLRLFFPGMHHCHIVSSGETRLRQCCRCRR